MLSFGRLAVLMLLATWGAACGGKAKVNDNDIDDGVGVGGSARGGSGGASAGKDAGGSSSAGKATGGTTSKPECEALLDDRSYFVPVSIINDSDETLYLGQEMVTCGAAPLFEVRDATHRALPQPDPCRSSCESFMNAGPSSCPPVCAPPSAIELAPGAGISAAWTGTYLELVQLPAQCHAEDMPAAQCDRAIAIEPGVFSFSARAGTKLDCRLLPSECSACTPDSQGRCVTVDALITGEIREAETKVELDASYGVGAGNGDGSGNGDGALQGVEIRFPAR